MTSYTVPAGTSAVSACGREFTVTDGILDAQDITSDMAEALARAGCCIVPPDVEEPPAPPAPGTAPFNESPQAHAAPSVDAVQPEIERVTALPEIEDDSIARAPAEQDHIEPRIQVQSLVDNVAPVEDEPESEAAPDTRSEKQRLADTLRLRGVHVDARASLTWLRAQVAALDG